MKQYAEHDRVGISHPLRKDEMYVRVFSGGYPYLKNGVLVRSDSLTPIYSYGKNYQKDDDRFALFVWTTNKNQEEIEQIFNELSKDVTKEQAQRVSSQGTFDYLS